MDTKIGRRGLEKLRGAMAVGQRWADAGCRKLSLKVFLVFFFILPSTVGSQTRSAGAQLIENRASSALLHFRWKVVGLG